MQRNIYDVKPPPTSRRWKVPKLASDMIFFADGYGNYLKDVVQLVRSSMRCAWSSDSKNSCKGQSYKYSSLQLCNSISLRNKQETNEKKKLVTVFDFHANEKTFFLFKRLDLVKSHVINTSLHVLYETAFINGWVKLGKLRVWIQK